MDIITNKKLILYINIFKNLGAVQEIKEKSQNLERKLPFRMILFPAKKEFSHLLDAHSHYQFARGYIDEKE